MVNTHFSEETAQSVMVMYEQRIEALLLNIKMLEMQLDYSYKEAKTYSLNHTIENKL